MYNVYYSFTEISYRLQTARSAVRQLLFHCMLPWLYNMELVDPSIPPSPAVDAQVIVTVCSNFFAFLLLNFFYVYFIIYNVRCVFSTN